MTVTAVLQLNLTFEYGVQQNCTIGKKSFMFCVIPFEKGHLFPLPKFSVLRQR